MPDWTMIAIVLPTLVLAYIIFGIAGFGTALVAAPILAHAMPIASVVPLLALLDFGAFARAPLGPRLERAAAAARLPFPVTILHGADRDWMPPGPSALACAGMRRHGVDAQVLLTPRAGHNLHLENPESFCAQVAGRIDACAGGGAT